ncbi:Regulator of RNase E activity RraB [Armatimonadetes bacterium GXS]|jgi:regulator of RNase E activity RraB|nr:Regulator of RNase E activity RraB [Armatimonadetes bacterium GXS]
MPRKQVLPFEEGDWMAAPLPSGGYAAILIARAPQKLRPPRFLAYCFTPRYPHIPTLHELAHLTAQDAFYTEIVHVFRPIDRQHLASWHKIGRHPHWNRDHWPVPPFIFMVSGHPYLFLQHYSEADLETIIAQEECTVEELLGRRLTTRDVTDVNFFVSELDRTIDAPPGDAEWVEEWYKRRREAEEFREWVLQRAEQERAAAQSLSEDDRHALELAYQAGVDPDKPAWVEHFLYFPKRRLAKQAAEELQAQGYTVEISPSGREWLLLATHQLLPTEDALDEAIEAMERFAERWEVVYDGWGMPTRQ